MNWRSQAKVRSITQRRRPRAAAAAVGRSPRGAVQANATGRLRFAVSVTTIGPVSINLPGSAPGLAVTAAPGGTAAKLRIRAPHHIAIYRGETYEQMNVLNREAVTRTRNGVLSSRPTVGTKPPSAGDDAV